MSKLLITGASGYIGRRLMLALADSQYQLVCTARQPEYLIQKAPKNATIVQADFSQSVGCQNEVADCEVAFFLMHSLGEKTDFERKEIHIAKEFLKLLEGSKVKKIIYLGGLAEECSSPHMKSRMAVGETLRSGSIPVIEFRASVIIGPGSLSFELIRALVERLPIMITPRWVNVEAQPIFVDDVIQYLQAALTHPFSESEIIEIGGADVTTYKHIMDQYAHLRGLKRGMIPVPFLTPHLSSLWLGLVTPIYARVGRKLIDSITAKSVVTRPENASKFPIKPVSVDTALSACLNAEDSEVSQSKWSTAFSSGRQFKSFESIQFGNRIVDVFRIKVPPHIQNPFQPIEEIGGENGWYYLNILWRIRGFLDLLMGGIGLRRGREHPKNIQVGDPLDWWRVEQFEAGKQLRLKAEMKVPGRAWLEFELVEKAESRYIQQTVVFDPLGLFGLLYWYSLLPIHNWMFKGMLKEIIRRAEK